MRFQKFSEYLQRLEETTLRNEMTEVLAKLFREASEDEIDKICYLSLGRLGPKFSTVQFNLAAKMMTKIIARAFGEEKERVVAEFKKRGDLGKVAYKLKVPAFAKASAGRQSPKLSVEEVYGRLKKIAEEGGEGSVESKVEKMASLLKELDPLSVKYVVRIPLARLRLGFSDMTILDSLSWMVTEDKSMREEIEAVYNVRADVGQIASLVKKGRLGGEGRLGLLLGTPVVPALCQRLPNAEEMIKKMGQVAVEPKYDGTRLQVHKGRLGKSRELGVRIFTRNLDNVTHMFPDIVAELEKEVKGKTFILDGEAIGFDPKTGRLLPFQETIKRKRKHGVKEASAKIPLKFYCFDILYKDGKDLLGRPFSERRKLLEETLKKENRTIILSPQIVTDDPQVIRRYHEEQIEKGLEGAVLKKLDVPYDPGRRGYTWVKFKSEKEGKRGGGLSDTLDCVILGFNRGEGKRAAFGIGAFLVGVRGPSFAKASEGKDFVTVSKIGTGLTDEQWREMRRRCEKVAVKKKPGDYQVDKNLEPDVWCKPGIVVEIEADNITKSPIHTAGFALRFPRLIRFRDDKDVEQATTLKEVEKLYRMQK